MTAAADLSRVSLLLPAALDKALATEPGPAFWAAFGVVRDLRAQQIAAESRLVSELRDQRRDFLAADERPEPVVDLQRRASSVAGLASFTGRHIPPRPKPVACSLAEVGLPCGHHIEDTCEACVPSGGAS